VSKTAKSVPERIEGGTMKSDAKTVPSYIKELPEDRQKAIKTVRKVLRDSLPKGYKEVMRWGMITYEVPLSKYPDTYNGEPLMYAALASQKRHMAVYLMGLYCDAKLNKKLIGAWKKRGTRLDMGKSCIRFSKIEQLELDLVGEAVAGIPVEQFIEIQKKLRTKKK
jgi:hypothetical protein